MRRLFVLLFVSVCSLTNPSRADEGPAPNSDATDAEGGALTTLLAASVERDPRRALADAQADATAARVGQARARLLPRVSATAGYTRNQYAGEVEVPGDADPIVVTPLDQLDATVRLDVPLVDAAGWAALAAAAGCREAGDADATAAREEALLEVARAAWALRTAERTRDAALAAVAANERVLGRAEARRAAGTGTHVDHLRATADLARTRGQLADAEADLAAARRALAARTGLDALPGALAPRAAPVGDLAAGAADRPAVRAARATVACRARTELSARLGAAPTLSAFAQERASNATGFAGEPLAWAAGATVNWTPIEGGRRIAEAAEATANRRAAEAALAQRERDAADALADAEARLAAARIVLAAAGTRATAAEAAADDARARFEAGTGLAVEVSLAVQDALDAAVALARAEATYALAVETLRVAAGRPLLEAR